MFESLEQAQAYIREHGITAIDLKFCDLWGRWRHVTLPASRFGAEILEEGIGFDGSSVGLKSVKAADMVLMPDFGTAFVDPFWEEPTISFICHILEADTRQPFHRDPRVVAARAEEYLRATDIGDETRWGPEFEFYIFDKVVIDNGPDRAIYRVYSSEADWDSAEGGHGHYIPSRGGYHAIPPMDRLANLRAEMTRVLEQIGVEVRFHHHEVGGPGQSEIETSMTATTVRTGDVVMLVKYVTRMVAHEHGYTATYMPKPLYGEAGNGMHFHQHIFKNGKNVFYSPNGYGHLSQKALFYIGGLLKHAPAVMAFTNPSTNSYRRLVPGFEAPVNAFFSLGNRSAAVRIPKYATAPDTARIEFRSPDATCNVYLALAAQLMAGLDGILNHIDPELEGFGPIDENVYAWTPERRRTIKALPSSLKEALEALEEDHDFLLAGGVFDEEMIADWISHKMAEEYYEMRNRPHPYELALYYDV